MTKKILIVILLVIAIVVGSCLLIYNNMQKDKNNVRFDDGYSVVQSFNNRYETYFGKNRSLSQVESLVSLVNAHNSNDDEKSRTGGRMNLIAPSIANLQSDGLYHVFGDNVKYSGYYTISSTKYNEMGFLTSISIEYFNTRQWNKFNIILGGYINESISSKLWK